MKLPFKTIGILLMVIGVALLVVLHLLRFTFLNVLLFVPLAFVLLGFVLYLFGMKRESRY